jgi:hypothetical protein
LEFPHRTKIDENQLCSRVEKTFHPFGWNGVEAVLHTMAGKQDGWKCENQPGQEKRNSWPRFSSPAVCHI